MKVTSNLSFLLCITSVVMPVVDARANSFGLNKRSAALKSRTTKAYDFAAHQQRRGLQGDDDGFDFETKEVCEAALVLLGTNPCTCDDQGVVLISVPECANFIDSLPDDDSFLGDDDEVCESLLAVFLGTPNSGCNCDDEAEPTAECLEFISSCNQCDTLQGVETCRSNDLEVSANGIKDCTTYESGAFDNTICFLDNFDDTCTITIDGTECNSCEPIECDGAENLAFGFDLDCSNVVDGETWNLCTADLPETSRFLAFGNNDRPITLSGCDVPAVDASGGFAPSLHALSVVGLVVVATFL
jgi:hypothetical protein